MSTGLGSMVRRSMFDGLAAARSCIEHPACPGSCYLGTDENGDPVCGPARRRLAMPLWGLLALGVGGAAAAGVFFFAGTTKGRRAWKKIRRRR